MRKIKRNIREREKGRRTPTEEEDPKRANYHYASGRRPLERKRTVAELQRTDAKRKQKPATSSANVHNPVIRTSRRHKEAKGFTHRVKRLLGRVMRRFGGDR